MRKLRFFIALTISVAGVAIPSTPSAASWTLGHMHLQFGNNVPLHMEGSLAFSSEIGGINCKKNVTAVALLTGGLGGHVTQFSLNPADCQPVGSLQGCTVTSIHVGKMPYSFGPAGAHVVSATVDLTYTLDGVFCLKNPLTLSGALTLVPDESEKPGHTLIQSFTFDDSFSTSLGMGATVSGVFALTPSQQNTFGFT